MQASIWIHPSDVLDEGPAAAFRALRGMSLKEISLAATYHAGRFLLPHDPASTVRLLEDGVAYYQPDPRRWSKLRLKPQAAAACDGKDPCAKVRAAAADAGFAVNAWIVALHNSRLGEANPDCTIVNAFSERYPWALCPSHP